MTGEKRFRSVRKELIILGCLSLLVVGGLSLLFRSRSAPPSIPERVQSPPTIPSPPVSQKGSLPIVQPTLQPVDIIPQSILVDNFDFGATTGVFKERSNTLGTYHGTWARRPSYTLMSKSQTIRRGETGQGLVIDYYKDGGWCGYYNLLAGIDVSGLNTLSFWVKGEKGGEKFDIGLTDLQMQELEIDAVYAGSVNAFLPQGVTTEWQEVKIPLSRIASDIDLNAMGSFVLWFRYEGKGRIYLEDIVFKSDPEVERILEETAPRAVRDPRHFRSLWVWNIDPSHNIRARKELFKLCERAAIQTLYLYFGEFSEEDDPEFARLLEEFLRQAHARGLKVEALTGNPIWQFEGNHPVALAWVKSFLEFNKTRPPEARLDGISLDIEPYLDQAWNERREEVKASFLVLLKKVRALINEYPDQEFEFGVVAPIFYESEGPTFERTMFETVDYVALMDYYDTAREIVSNARFHLQLAQEMGKKVTVGVETQDLVAMKQGGRRNTFFEEGWEGMEEVLRQVAKELNSFRSFDGFAIHHFSSYKNLQRERNVPTKERKDLYTITARQATYPPVLDGDLSEWEELTTTPPIEAKDHVVYGQGAWRGESDTSFKAVVRWDPEALYLAVVVFDDRLVQVKSGKDLWEGDHLELWLDMDLMGDYEEAINSDDDFQLGFSPGNFESLRTDSYLWTPPLPEERLKEITMAAKKIDGGYTLEARIPAKFLFSTAQKESQGARFAEGNRFGISIEASDTDEARVPQKCLLSTSTNRIWGDPTTFGILELK